MNKVILIGRLTKDPELRTTPSNVATTSFSIAVDSTEYKLEFSKKLNLMRLTDKADYQKDFYILSGKCYIGHIVATSVSIILDLIV